MLEFDEVEVFVPLINFPYAADKPGGLVWIPSSCK